jgi:hypothetical protein
MWQYLLIYSMEQSPSSEANRFSASQEIPRILWSPTVHHRIHKCPPPVHVVVQKRLINSVVDKASIMRSQMIPNLNPGEHRRLKITDASKDSPQYMMLVVQPAYTVW